MLHVYLRLQESLRLDPRNEMPALEVVSVTVVTEGTLKCSGVRCSQTHERGPHGLKSPRLGVDEELSGRCDAEL